MSQYRHLPIYKAAYDLLQAVTRATAGFPRAWKYSFGDKLRTEALELVVLIYHTNSHSGSERLKYADSFLEKLVATDMLLRTAKDMHLLNVKQFSEMVGLADSLGKQAKGWKKATEKLLAELK